MIQISAFTEYKDRVYSAIDVNVRLPEEIKDNAAKLIILCAQYASTLNQIKIATKKKLIDDYAALANSMLDFETHTAEMGVLVAEFEQEVNQYVSNSTQ